MLEKLEELVKAQEKLEEREKVLHECKKELAILKRKAEEYVLSYCLDFCSF